MAVSTQASGLRGVGGHRRCPLSHDRVQAASHHRSSPTNHLATDRAGLRSLRRRHAGQGVIVKSSSVSGELLRRSPQREWAGDPLVLDAESLVELASVGFAASMRDIYATTSLAGE